MSYHETYLALKTHVLHVTTPIKSVPENGYLELILKTVESPSTITGMEIRIQRLRQLAFSLDIRISRLDIFQRAFEWFGVAVNDKFNNDAHIFDYLVNFVATVIKLSNKLSPEDLKKIIVLGVITTRFKFILTDKLENDIDEMFNKLREKHDHVKDNLNHALVKAVDDYVSEHLKEKTRLKLNSKNV